jgi:hypothetical protein
MHGAIRVFMPRRRRRRRRERKIDRSSRPVGKHDYVLLKCNAVFLDRCVITLLVVRNASSIYKFMAAQ